VIVTRRRRKAFPYRRLLLPVAAVALVAIALAWPPSRRFITTGPLAPVWNAASGVAQQITAPFHFAAQNEVITDRDRTIARLTGELTAAQKRVGEQQRQIASLQSQIEQLQLRALASHAATPKPVARASANGFAGSSGLAAGSAGDLSAGATPDMRRTAAYWASMDPENAAKLVQRLPPAYDARIFSLMQPDAVGAILDALPPAFAAKLMQANPALAR
jgi:uncharacterized coiled-coil protein SlyX